MAAEQPAHFPLSRWAGPITKKRFHPLSKGISKWFLSCPEIYPKMATSKPVDRIWLTLFDVCLSDTSIVVRYTYTMHSSSIVCVCWLYLVTVVKCSGKILTRSICLEWRSLKKYCLFPNHACDWLFWCNLRQAQSEYTS